MAEYYVTIGVKHREGHPLMRELTPDGYMTVEAEDEAAARTAVNEVLGRDWAFIYPTLPTQRNHPAGSQATVVVTPIGISINPPSRASRP